MKILLTVVMLMPIMAMAGNLPSKSMKEAEQAPRNTAMPEFESVADETWQERLTPDQYQILRKAATEAPNGEVYQQFKKQGGGTYYCAGCGAKLFHSDQKFDAHCGWPSFWDPAEIDSIETRVDNSFGVTRTEVICGTCKGHLGHLFEGEGFNTPSNQRYCINGTVLVFVLEGDGTEKQRKGTQGTQGT